ncbi:MAG: SWIM zinc finger family protein, partial [Ghiorsea sp.]
MKFTKRDLQDEVSIGYYQRGQTYFNQGKVIALKALVFSHDSVEFEAEVKGRDSLPYTQKISVTEQSDEILVDGFCSCPVVFNCKHVVAACLQYLSDEEEKEKLPDALSWLGKFSDSFASGSKRGAEQKTADKFLVYILSISKALHTVEVTFRSVAFLKSGKGLSKGSEAHFVNLANI